MTEEAIVVLDEDLRVVGWDRGMERLTGRSFEQVAGRPGSEAIPGRCGFGTGLYSPDCPIVREARAQGEFQVERVSIEAAGGVRELDMSTTTAVVCGGFAFVHVFRPASGRRRSRKRSPLTPRQRQVLALLADGRGTREIAARLEISKETARNHIRDVIQRLGCHSRLEAVALARREGFV